MAEVFSNLTTPRLVEMVQAGSIGVLPTDTVYGLVGDASNPAAVERIFTVKKRDHNPGTVLAASVEQLADLGIPRRYLTAVEGFWPNALSIIIPCGPDLDYLHMGKGSLAVRIPADEQLRAFLAQTGPLMTTSANHPGEPTATNYDAAYGYFGDAVEYYVDMGELGVRPPSTIIRIVDDAIEIVRAGAVNIDENGRITP